MPQGWTPVQETAAPVAPAVAAAGWTPVAEPTFSAVNEKDEQGNAVVSGAGKVWDAINTPLIPQIGAAAHAIAEYMSQPREGDAELNEHFPGLGTLSASLRGGAAGMVEGAGDMASSFTSAAGVAMTLAGLGPESALLRKIPALASLLKLPQVQTLQKAVQAAGGTAFGAHGAGRVVTAPTLGEKAQGLAEMAGGAVGAVSAMRSGAPGAKPVPRLTPAEEASNAFAGEHGIPLDAATATGSGALRAVEKRVSHTLGGEPAAVRLIDQQQQGLARVGGELADQARGAAVTPEQAGQGVRDALTSKSKAHTALADEAYERLRQMEADPTRLEAARVTSEEMGFPVNTSGAKAALKPVFDQMMRQLPVTQQQANPGLKAIANILEGPEWASLSQVDRDLSAIKALARQHGGLAKIAVSKLDAAVREAARNGGPAVERALEQGRLATIGKVGTENVLDALPGGKFEEPTAVYKRATAPKDGGIAFLRQISEQTPHAIPQIARAKLDEMLATATERNRFDHADKLYADWQHLGAETKKILFPDEGHRAAMDQFFLLAKRLAENPNPSGTAHVSKALDLVYSLGTFPLAKVLYTPRGVKAVTRFMKMQPAKPSATTLRSAAQTAGWVEVVAAARAAGVQMDLPKAADASPDREQQR